MKNIDYLPLKKNYTEEQIYNILSKNALENGLEEWLKHKCNRDSLKEKSKEILSKDNAWCLALKDASFEEFYNLSHSNVRVTKIEKPLSEYFRTYGKVSQFVDFEENKYDYYEVVAEYKRSVSFYTIRVVK